MHTRVMFSRSDFFFNDPERSPKINIISLNWNVLGEIEKISSPNCLSDIFVQCLFHALYFLSFCVMWSCVRNSFKKQLQTLFFFSRKKGGGDFYADYLCKILPVNFVARKSLYISLVSVVYSLINVFIVYCIYLVWLGCMHYIWFY